MNRRINNKTKIIATVGPACESEEVLLKMFKAGVNVCRINASHGDHKAHQTAIDRIKSLNERHNYSIPILFDLQGPKLRIGDVKDGAVIKEGSELYLTTEECLSDESCINLKYPSFYSDVEEGDTVLIDDGRIKLKIKTKEDSKIIAKVIHGGMLSSRKGVNLPYTNISMPSLTQKDLIDLDFALKNDVEWIALSFVRHASDVTNLKSIIKSKGKTAKVIAKMEKPEAVQNMDEIIEVSDAIMVARGDLGVEMLMEEIPIIQKILVRKAIAAAKPVIIATQMMESMITNYRPTRAEANDVGNAVIDGADAVMLSAETSVGEYPVEVVESMYKIIMLAQNDESIYNRGNPPNKNSPLFISDSICYNSTVMADQSGAKAIVAMTHSGFTAFKIASQRPHADILIFTDNKPIVRMLTLLWGVQGFFYDKYTSSDETISDVKEILKKEGFVESGDILIHIASMPIHDRATANTIKLNFVE